MYRCSVRICSQTWGSWIKGTQDLVDLTNDLPDGEAPFHTPLQGSRVPVFHSFMAVLCAHGWIFASLISDKWYLSVVLIYLYLIVNKVETFSQASWPFVFFVIVLLFLFLFFVEDCVFMSFVHFYFGLLVISYWILENLYELGRSVVSYQLEFSHSPIPFVTWVLILLTVFCGMNRRFGLLLNQIYDV